MEIRMPPKQQCGTEQHGEHNDSATEVAEGFTFQLPSQGLAVAVAVFGITGVGAAELYVQ